MFISSNAFLLVINYPVSAVIAIQKSEPGVFYTKSKKTTQIIRLFHLAELLKRNRGGDAENARHERTGKKTMAPKCRGGNSENGISGTKMQG